MSIEVRTSTAIAVSAQTAFDFAANPDQAPRWYANIESIEWKNGPGVSLGRSAAFVARFMGRRMAYTYEMVVVEPGRRLVMAADDGPFAMRTEYLIEELGPDECRFTLINSGGPKGFMRLFNGLMAGQMRKANEKDLASLKSILEAA